MFRPCLLLLCCAASAAAQTPVVDRTHSMHLSPGSDAVVTVYGKTLKNATTLWTSACTLPLQPAESANDQQAVFTGRVASGVVPGLYPGRLFAKHGVSSPFYLVIDDLPGFRPAAATDQNPPAVDCPIPCCIEGVMPALKPQFWGLPLQRGQQVTVEVYARRLNSALDPVLRLLDPDGNEVAFADDRVGLAGDASFAFTAPADGRYTLCLRDVQYSGSRRHFFHLRIGTFHSVASAIPRRAAADQNVELVSLEPKAEAILLGNVSNVDRLTLPVAATSNGESSFAEIVRTEVAPLMEAEPNDQRDDATDVPPEATALSGRFDKANDVDWFRLNSRQGQPVSIVAHTRSLGAPTDLVLQLLDSTGKQLTQSDEAGSADARIVFTPKTDAPCFLCVRELTGSCGPAWTYDLQLDRGGTVEATFATDAIAVPARGCVAVPVNIARLGYAGPIVLRAVTAPARFRIPQVHIAAGQKTAFVTIESAAADSDDDVFHTPLRFAAELSGLNRTTPVLFKMVAKKGQTLPLRNPVRADVFAFAAAAASPFVLQPEPSRLSLVAGTEGSVRINAIRNGDRKEPIQLSSAVPAGELSKGLQLKPVTIKEGEAAFVISTSSDLAPGQYTVSLQGTLKVDKKTMVQPVPSIHLTVTAKTADP